MEENVDAHGVPVRGELVEERRVLSFTFPRIRDVGVVGHHHHDSALLVAHGPEMRHRAVGAEQLR